MMPEVVPHSWVGRTSQYHEPGFPLQLFNLSTLQPVRSHLREPMANDGFHCTDPVQSRIPAMQAVM